MSASNRRTSSIYRGISNTRGRDLASLRIVWLRKVMPFRYPAGPAGFQWNLEDPKENRIRRHGRRRQQRQVPMARSQGCKPERAVHTSPG